MLKASVCGQRAWGGLLKCHCGHIVKKGRFSSSSEQEVDHKQEQQTSTTAAILSYILRSAETGLHTLG